MITPAHGASQRSSHAMKRVIAFCLWGSDPFYWKGAIENARIAQTLFPGWECLYHVASQKIPESDLRELQSLENTRIIEHPGEGDPSGMLWRFEEADAPDVDVFLSRDTDSRLSERERSAVDRWLASGRRFHVMRDHPEHRCAMLGGMWGCRSTRAVRLKTAIELWLHRRTGKPCHGMDQDFLAEVVWPEARKDCLVHDPFFSGRPFPQRRRGRDGVYFVGERFSADNRPAFLNDRDALDTWVSKWRYLKWIRRFRPCRF